MKIGEIIDSESEPNCQRSGEDITPLQWAIFNQRMDDVNNLLKEGANPAQLGLQQESALHTAAKIGNPDYLKSLLSVAPNVNIIHPITLATPLHVAVQVGRKMQVELLLAAGANLNQANRIGDTPLHIAAKINSPELVLILLKSGADPQLQNKQQSTFQVYLNLTPLKARSREMQAGYDEVNHWLKARQISQYYSK
ncbi:ankyrin repeat domain-containing protein [Photorhabdus namnaonensis]|uniref:Ankyrin repeats (3 copies) n=1 Tax=Photorhabdus namnaonensis TaxID=1851568 RepID=A0A1B8YLG2_9GAMM|nr:ankyrin repeat domain-containing protein [Photorhabdus namnaonensis]OCA56012.1 Ankyrin repeats (3 copies) [Photorhabdus namnaonensis]